MLVNRAGPKAVEHIFGTANKRKKVRKIIIPEESPRDGERVAQKPKKVTIKMSKKKK